MSEHEIMWIGRQPKVEGTGSAEVETPDYAEAVVAACELAAREVERYVAAKGPFGSWLVELKDDGTSQRLLWNGQASELSLQQRQPSGLWDTARLITPAAGDLATLLDAVQQILTEPETGPA